MSGVRYLDDEDIAYHHDSNTELMVYGDLYSSTSWPRYHHADHVQAILNMSEAYLHAAASYQDERVAYNDRWANTWSVQPKKVPYSGKQRARRTYSADRYRHQQHQQPGASQHDPIARRYSAGAEWRRRPARETSETEEDEEEIPTLEINDHLARCQCTCDHMGYSRNSRRQPQPHREMEDDNGNSSLYPPESSRTPTKPEVTFYPQGSSTPSSTSVASGTLMLMAAPRRWLAVLAVLLIAVGVGVGVPLALRSGSDNKTSLQQRLELATRLLHEVPLVDGHNDLPWNIRKFLHNRLRDFRFGEDLRKVVPWSNSPWSHTDLPRLRAGHVAAQFWAAYVPCESQFLDAVQLTLEQIDVIRRLTEKYHPSLILCTSVADIKAAHAQGRVCSLIGVEGGHSLASSLPVLRTLYSVGVRYLTLTSNCNTPWADSQQVDAPGKKPEHNGLTSFGKSVVKEMNRLGMLVDLSHVAVHTMLAALEVSRAPVIFSHSSARALCNSTRNVPDHVLRHVALKGGLVMINFYSQFLTCRNTATADDAVAHINHIRNVAGVDSVGLGAGYDGINLTPEGLEDVSTYPTLFAALIGTGQWSIDDLKKLAGLNFLRVMQEVEKVRDTMRAAGVAPYEDDDTNIKRNQKNCSSVNLF